MSIKRILLYAHEGLGLGHLSRTCRVANTLRQNFSCLVITGQGHVANFVEPDVDFVKLPSADALFSSRANFLGMRPLMDKGDDYATAFRRELINVVVERYRPHAIITDHSLTGKNGELFDAMTSSLVEKRYLMLRPVLGDPQISKQHLFAYGGDKVLQSSIDRILVAGDNASSTVELDLLNERSDIASRISNVGFAVPTVASRDIEFQRKKRNLFDRFWVVCSAGSGFRSAPFVDIVREAAELCDADVVFDLVLGNRGSIATDLPPSITQYGFLHDLPMMHAASDLVVCHGGYNTMVEAISGRTPIAVAACDWEDPVSNDERLANLERMSDAYPIDRIESGEQLANVIKSKRARVTSPPHSRRLNENGLSEILRILVQDLCD